MALKIETWKVTGFSDCAMSSTQRHDDVWAASCGGQFQFDLNLFGIVQISKLIRRFLGSLGVKVPFVAP